MHVITTQMYNKNVRRQFLPADFLSLQWSHRVVQASEVWEEK